MTKKSIVIHPLLLAIYPVLFLYSHNIGQVAFREILAPSVITAGLTVTAWFILRAIFKNWKKSGIIASLFLVLFFSYGYFRAFLEGETATPLMLSAWIVLFMLGSFFTVRSKKDFAKATVILNVITSILIVLPVLNVIIHQFTNIRLINQANYSMSMQASSSSTTERESYPDIYFIVLDAYAREDILREIYNFDNSEFLNFLRDKGFYIADRSVSNYSQTGLSFGSCFNISYLDGLVEQIGQYNNSRLPLDKVFEESLVFTYLRKKGYKIAAFQLGLFHTDLQSADVCLKQENSFNMFHNALKNMTPLPDIMVLTRTDNVSDQYRQNILFALDNFGEAARALKSPKFVFAHFELPHPPFVFGPNGEERNLEAGLNDCDGDWLIRRGRLSLEGYRRCYRDQIVFLNSRMKKVVDDILKNSEHPPIIMILADHGPRSGLVWENPNKTDVHECMSILNAYYLPNNGDELLYPEISLVNSFRVILNHYFGEQFDLLPDRCYFSTASHLYKFYDVTERVRKQP